MEILTQASPKVTAMAAATENKMSPVALPQVIEVPTEQTTTSVATTVGRSEPETTAKGPNSALATVGKRNEITVEERTEEGDGEAAEAQVAQGEDVKHQSDAKNSALFVLVRPPWASSQSR